MLQVDVVVPVPGLLVACQFEVGSGDAVALVGASGAGKTTLLRAIAGLARPQAGRIESFDRCWFDFERNTSLSPQQRNCGMVFAGYALFPHLSALENVAFGLRACGHGGRKVARVAEEMLDLVGVASLAARRASALSSGEAQRVAIARALATAPDVLLLDEPLCAIDVEQRPPVREALRRTIAQAGMAAVIVTHDPVEAMLFSDQLVVLERGKVVQRGTPAELRERPRSTYVAAFAGVNLYRGAAHPTDGGISVVDVQGAMMTVVGDWSGPVALVVDPDSVVLSRARPDSSARNCLSGPVLHVVPDGGALRISVASTPHIVARVTKQSASDLGIVAGVHVAATFKASEIRVH